MTDSLLLLNRSVKPNRIPTCHLEMLLRVKVYGVA